MNSKENFVNEFEKVTGKHPNDFKENPKALATILTGYPDLLILFRQAISEIDNTTAGLDNLFPMS